MFLVLLLHTFRHHYCCIHFDIITVAYISTSLLLHTFRHHYCCIHFVIITVACISTSLLLHAFRHHYCCMHFDIITVAYISTSLLLHTFPHHYCCIHFDIITAAYISTPLLLHRFWHHIRNGIQLIFSFNFFMTIYVVNKMYRELVDVDMSTVFTQFYHSFQILRINSEISYMNVSVFLKRSQNINTLKFTKEEFLSFDKDEAIYVKIIQPRTEKRPPLILHANLDTRSITHWSRSPL